MLSDRPSASTSPALWEKHTTLLSDTFTQERRDRRSLHPYRPSPVRQPLQARHATCPSISLKWKPQ